MTSTVYDGVGEGGTLFAGTTFFVMQRVPLRSRWVDQIKANGGEVVKLDTQADMIIGDHARNGQPAGSISWTYIQDSVKEGRLQKTDDHRAGPAFSTSRPVGAGASQPARIGRTPFTAEDDKILAKFVAKAERRGVSTRGNELYKEFAATNSRHTFQSWRDRWIKYLSERPRPPLSDDEEDEEDEDPEDGDGKTKHLHEDQRKTNNAYFFSELPIPKNVGSGTTFTSEETDLLLHVRPLQPDDIWEPFAQRFKSHTAQEWKMYFNEYFDPKRKRQAKEAKEAKEAKVSSGASEVSSRPVAEVNAKRSNTDTDSASGSSRRFPVVEIPPMRLQHPVRDEWQEDVRSADSKVTEDYFEQLVTGFAAQHDLELDLHPVICGRKIPLFRVWQVVRSDAFRGFDNVEQNGLWLKVARQLEFNDSRDKDAPEQLRSCYEEILTDFDEAREAYDGNGSSPTSSQLEDLLQTQLLQTASREAEDAIGLMQEEEQEQEQENEDGGQDDGQENSDDLDLPPAPSNSRKRPADHSGSSLTSSQVYNKRQRINKNKGKEREIPSTPEDVLNGEPAVRSAQEPSPLKRSSFVEPEKIISISSTDEDEDEEEDGYEERFGLTIPRPDFTGSKSRTATQRVVEPETQDFRYDASVEQDDDLPSSPIQQKISSKAAVQALAEDDSSTQSQSDSQREAEASEFIDRHIALGYPVKIVVQALEITTMETGDAAIVMESLMRGDGIPKDIQGVWTEEDDAALEAGEVDTERFTRVVKKHGIIRAHTRRKFLADMEEAKAQEDG